MRQSHDPRRQGSARLAVKAWVFLCGFFCGSLRRVGLNEVVRFSRGAKTYCQTGEARGLFAEGRLAGTVADAHHLGSGSRWA